MPVPEWLAAQEALLLLELHGRDEEALLTAAEEISTLAEELGCGEIQAAQDAAEQRRLWQIRRKVGDALMQGGGYREADAVVPRSRLADLVRAAREAAARQGSRCCRSATPATATCTSTCCAAPSTRRSGPDGATPGSSELLERVRALGGSITGEHGIGWTLRAPFASRLSAGEPRPDAPDQARLRPRRRPQSGQDLPGGVLSPAAQDRLAALTELVASRRTAAGWCSPTTTPIRTRSPPRRSWRACFATSAPASPSPTAA